MIRLTLLLVLLATPALAQELTLSLGEGGSFTTRTLQLLTVITLLSLVPGLAVMLTCFPFVVTVLSILRQALGLQAAPPNMVIVTLALFLTYFVMDPVFTESWQQAGRPFSEGTLPLEEAVPLALAPFRQFMAARLDAETFSAMVDLRPDLAAELTAAEAPLSVLLPSFLLSEISRAFQIGFLLFLPFLIIDLVTAAILMSMGMMMVPPAIVSLPFKLAFFVAADGWSLVASALVRSYG